jgi:hypothetical protein
METLTEEIEFATDGFGLTSGAILAYNQTIDGSLWARLRAGSTGSMSWTQTASGTGQNFQLQISLPLEDHLFRPVNYLINLGGSTVVGASKEVMNATLDVSANASTLYSIALAIDPPQDRGLWGRIKDFGTTTVTCVAGGVGAQMAAMSTKGKKAIVKMVGKAAARKIIPGVGLVCTAGCIGCAIGDQIWGY